jgi:quinolinate synthase
LNEQIIKKIKELKIQKNAVILAHNYQIAEVQDIADITGDSLGLSKQAAETSADVIVFCGVKFMAETAKILSPAKTVLLPEPNAGCPMADMITAQQLREFKAHHPGAIVVCYVNTTAEVKAESDYCCTSSNAVEVVRRLPEDKNIIFVPDKNLGQHVAQQTGRDLILWPGYCSTHTFITAEDVDAARNEHPDAELIAHPECTPEVRAKVDQLLSTGGMLKYAKKSHSKEFVVVTEKGIIHTLRKENPDKNFYAVSPRAICPNMKKINLEKILWALQRDQYRIELPTEIMKKAKTALDRMLEVLP